MLEDINSQAVVAVSDISHAKDFYEGKLGLKAQNEDPGGITYQSGSSRMLVYESQYAGTNKATNVFWEVGDLDAIVEQLKSAGIKFEHYHLEGARLEGDIHVMGPMRAAWFKDPDGNILCVGDTL